MSYGAGGIRVRGLKELNRAFRQYGSKLPKEIRDELKDVGEPVRRQAEVLASEKISGLAGNQPWSQMRLGTTSTTVYIAPKQRGHGGSPRPAFGLRLLQEAMQPALDQKEEDIRHGLEHALDRLGRREGF